MPANMGSHSYPHLLFSRFLPPPLLPPRPYSINHCAFLSNFQPLRLYLDVLIKYSQCVPVLHFLYLLMIYLFVKRRGRAIILIALHLLVAFHVPYLLSSPRVLAYRRDGRCFWFSCCFSSFTHPLLLVFHFGSAAPLFSLFSCLASGLPSATGFSSPFICRDHQLSALCCRMVSSIFWLSCVYLKGSLHIPGLNAPLFLLSLPFLLPSETILHGSEVLGSGIIRSRFL